MIQDDTYFPFIKNLVSKTMLRMANAFNIVPMTVLYTIVENLVPFKDRDTLLVDHNSIKIMIEKFNNKTEVYEQCTTSTDPSKYADRRKENLKEGVYEPYSYDQSSCYKKIAGMDASMMSDDSTIRW